MPEVIFSCPYCGSPFATPVAKGLVDIHSGASYACGDCGEVVTFEAFTGSEYVAYCTWKAGSHASANPN